MQLQHSADGCFQSCRFVFDSNWLWQQVSGCSATLHPKCQSQVSACETTVCLNAVRVKYL